MADDQIGKHSQSPNDQICNEDKENASPDKWIKYCFADLILLVPFILNTSLIMSYPFNHQAFILLAEALGLHWAIWKKYTNAYRPDHSDTPEKEEKKLP